MAKRFGSTTDYYEALRALEPSLRPHQIGLLLGHMAAPGHTLSWRELAPVVGYKSGSAVHLQYGKLARLVADRLGVPEGRREFQLSVLADWGPDLDGAGHTTFRLRDEVVGALRRLGWRASGQSSDGGAAVAGAPCMLPGP